MATRWKTLVETRDAVPDVACVYVFIKDGRAFYVGSTVNLRARIRQHFSPRAGGFLSGDPTPLAAALMSCGTVKYKPSRRYGDWLMYEARLLRRLRGAGNVPRMWRV